MSADADPIARLNAALEGRYRVERELSEGGMATRHHAIRTRSLGTLRRRTPALAWCLLCVVGCNPLSRTTDTPSTRTDDLVQEIEPDTLFGQLLVIWVDARDQTSRAPAFFAVDSVGLSVQLSLDPELLSPFGGPAGVDRKWLTFIGRNVLGAAPSFQVEAVRRNPESTG